MLNELINLRLQGNAYRYFIPLSNKFSVINKDITITCCWDVVNLGMNSTNNTLWPSGAIWRHGSRHYIDVIMTTMTSQITSLIAVYSTVYPDAVQRKHQSSVSLAFVWGIHRKRWIPHTKGQLRGKCFHLMTSSCKHLLSMWAPMS